MTKLWVKFKPINAIRVSTEDCQDVYDLLKACKKELPRLLASYDVDQLTLSTTADGPPLEPEDDIPTQNTAQNPLFITAATTVANNGMVSTSSKQATMQFIAEATGIVENINRVWLNIPVDTSLEASSEFVELFKKNASAFYFDTAASKRTVIDLFLREVVAQFPDFVIMCEYEMYLVNEAKKRSLDGICDYAICHRNNTSLPHLVVLVSEVANKDNMLQRIGECASIHYRRKKDGMKNLKVYGIQATGSKLEVYFYR